MGFRQGAYAKIWKVDDDTGYNFATCQMSVSKGNMQEGYKTEFQDGFVRLIGNAHKAIKEYLECNDIPENGLYVQISSCDVTNNYDKKNKKLYVNYAVFGMRIADEDGNFDDEDKEDEDGGSGKKSARGKKATSSKAKKSSSTKDKNSKKPKEEAEDIIDDLGDDDDLPF